LKGGLFLPEAESLDLLLLTLVDLLFDFDLKEMIGTLGLSALSVFNFIRGDLILFNLIRPSLEPLALFFLTY